MHTVAAGVLVRDGQVLLVHRHPARRWYPDVWDLPGGHVEDDESPVAAVVRELDEELGVDVDPARCTLVREVVATDGSLRMSVWLIGTWTGEAVNCCPAEHDDLGWFAADQLGGLTLADPLLGDLLAGVLRP